MKPLAKSLAVAALSVVAAISVPGDAGAWGVRTCCNQSTSQQVAPYARVYVRQNARIRPVFGRRCVLVRQGYVYTPAVPEAQTEAPVTPPDAVTVPQPLPLETPIEAAAAVETEPVDNLQATEAAVEAINACEAVVETEETDTEIVGACVPVQVTETQPICQPCSPVDTTTVTACTPCDSPTCGEFTPVRRPVLENLQVARINAARLARGVRALVLDDRLEQGAEVHCKNMAYSGRLYHAFAPEIVAYNYSIGIDFAVRQWTRSPGHYRILYSPRYTRVGVSSYKDAYGRNWCTARFQ